MNALLSMRTLNPEPDQIILITDGLPTQGSVAAVAQIHQLAAIAKNCSKTR